CYPSHTIELLPRRQVESPSVRSPVSGAFSLNNQLPKGLSPLHASAACPTLRISHLCGIPAKRRYTFLWQLYHLEMLLTIPSLSDIHLIQGKPQTGYPEPLGCRYH